MSEKFSDIPPPLRDPLKGVLKYASFDYQCHSPLRGMILTCLAISRESIGHVCEMAEKDLERLEKSGTPTWRVHAGNMFPKMLEILEEGGESNGDAPKMICVLCGLCGIFAGMILTLLLI